MQAGGGVLGAFGHMYSGARQRDAAYNNAFLEEWNANNIDVLAPYALQQQKSQNQKVIGSARAQYGASGVQSNEGSALDVLERSSSQAALEQVLYKRQLENLSYSHRLSAQNMRQAGDDADTAGKIAAFGSMLSAGASLLG